MKKFLLPMFAVCLFVVPAIADDAVYGTTPETAKPFPTGGWFVENIETAPKEAWFTIKNEQETPVLWGTATGPSETPQQIFVYLCDGGQEAFQMTPGDDSYALMPGQEYLVKITPIEPGFFCSMPATPFPDSYKGKEKFYPIDRTSTDVESPNYKGLANQQAAGTTAYYLYDFAYPSQLTINTNSYPQMPAMDITNVEVIHIECPGGTNTGTGVMTPYVKAGRNVIGITVSENAEVDDKNEYDFIITLNAFSILNCGNNLLRGKSMTLDTPETYADAYYTVDRFFTIPEDGTYTFTNHGAVGTILNVGTINVTDAANFKYECPIEYLGTATVGNEDAVVVVEDLKKGETILVQSDAFGVIGEGMDNQPYLMVTKGNNSAVGTVAADGNTIKVAVANGVLSVESVLLASGAEVAVYDMNANKVVSATAATGDAILETALDIAPGVYIVVVYGKGNSESAKIVVK